MFLWNLNGSNYPAVWWFTNNPSVQPSSSADGDPIAYYPVFVDANHATLQDINGNTVNYQGAGCTPSCTRGWTTDGGATGFGVQPYMLGILATALDFAAKAMTCTSPGIPTSCDNTVSATAKSYNIAMGHYLQNTGYWPARKAMYYATSFPNCQQPISDTNPACTDLNNDDTARTLNGEALRGVMTAYNNSGDPGLLAFGDTLYTAMWAKPGFSVPAGLAGDGKFLWSFNSGLGWNMTGTPPGGQAHKYFGMSFGIGDGSAWPGYRIGGTHTGSMVHTTVAFDLTKVTNAAKVNLLVTYPTGATQTIACPSSPCQVSFDQRVGNPTFRKQYLSASGTVLATQPDPTPILLN